MSPSVRPKGPESLEKSRRRLVESDSEKDFHTFENRSDGRRPLSATLRHYVRLGLRLLLSLLGTALLMLGLTALTLFLLRPARTPVSEFLFQGVFYERIAEDAPRRVMLHHVTIDLKTAGIRLLVTPGERNAEGELRAQTTREFVARNGVQLAINGSFFEPFHSDGLYDYYPHPGDPVNVIGQSTSNGDTYSTSDGPRGTLCMLKDGQALLRRGRCPEGAEQALAGHVMLVENGKVLPQKSDKPEPRTLVGLSDRGNTMHWLVVDGRQPDYSEGLGLNELAKKAQELGITNALNLDGGGSTTLVKARKLLPELLNAPIHTRIPMRERPVANHLGIFALPLANP